MVSAHFDKTKSTLYAIVWLWHGLVKCHSCLSLFQIVAAAFALISKANSRISGGLRKLNIRVDSGRVGGHTLNTEYLGSQTVLSSPEYF